MSPQKGPNNESEKDNRLSRSERLTASIAVLALIATAGSCVAAWQSWRTARAAEEVSRIALELGGPVIAVDGLLHYYGECQSDSDRATVKIKFNNTGRMGASVSAALLVREKPAEPIEGVIMPGGNWVDLTVPASSTAAAEVTESCAHLKFREYDIHVVHMVAGGEPMYTSAYPIEGCRKGGEPQTSC